MFPESQRIALSCAMLLALGAACTSDEPLTSVDAGTPAPATDAGAETDAGSPTATLRTSAKARVRFKKAERYRNDLAQALQLNPNQVCQELGQYDCVEFVHTVALGGVEPYTLGITAPLDDTTATTPLAVERVALSACGQRVDADFADPDAALIFKSLPVDSGTLSNPDAESVTQALTTLVQRSLLRDPRPEELSQLRALYGQITQDGAPEPARDWAVLSCFVVVTSLEALFY